MALPFAIAEIIPAGAFLTSRALKNRLLQDHPFKKHLVQQGLILVLPLFLLASLPQVLVNVGLELAQSSSQHQLGVQILRRFGNSHDMIRIGCSRPSSLADIWTFPLQCIRPLSERKARKTYEEVTGKSYEESAKQEPRTYCTDSMNKVNQPAN